MATYRKAEQKSTRNWLIGATIVTGIVFLLFLLPFNTYLHHYFVNAGTAWKVLGVISYAAWLWFLWTKAFKIKSNPSLILIVWLILTFAMLGGFNFSLP